MAALFSRHGLSPIERLLFSLGTSLGLAAVGGVILNLTPWGLQTPIWLLYLGIITLGSSAIALRRRAMDPPEPLQVIRPIVLPAPASVFLTISAVLVLIAATRISVNGQADQPGPGYTQLWILPVPVHAGVVRTVQVGITNDEVSLTTYRLVLTVHGRMIRTWPSISLAPGRGWQQTVRLPSAMQAADRAQVTLYRTLAPKTIYRQAWLEHDQ